MKPKHWACAVVATPERAHSLALHDTLDSLHEAGFKEPIIFMDGPAFYANYDVRLKQPVGNPKSWALALAHLWLLKPKANMFAVFEDDILACTGLKDYLNSSTFPADGYWNLLTHDANADFVKKERGWHLSNQRGLGACGLVFDDRCVDAMFTTGLLMRRARAAKAGVDGIVMFAMRSVKRKEYVHYPSLIQHVGIKSAMGHKYGKIPLEWDKDALQSTG